MTTTPEDLLATWRACWRTPAHLAVVHGPDAGWILPLDGERTVGRRGCDLDIADPGISPRHVAVRPRAGSGGLEVRDLRSENGTRLVPHPPGGAASRRRRRRLERALREVTGRGRRRGAGPVPTRAAPSQGSRADVPADAAAAASDALARAERSGIRVGRRWRPLALGDVLVLGRTRIEVRPGAATGPGAFVAHGTAVADAARHGAPPARRPWLALLGLVPALAMVGLLVSGGASPTLRWVMLGGIGLSLLLGLGAGLRRPRGAASTPASGGHDSSGPRDPAALALCAAGLGRLDPRWPSSGAPGQGGAGPLAGLAAADATGGAIDSGTVLGALPPGAEGGSIPVQAGAGVATVLPGEGLAVVGSGAPARAAWLRAQLDATGRTETPVLASERGGTLPPGPWTMLAAEERCGVSPAWRAAVGRALDPAGRPLELPALLGRTSAAGAASAWLDGPRWSDDLSVPLGHDPAGRTVEIDLVADGPHALVAGTTGSGKSELLSAWVLALAVRHPPSRLHLLLVDYKGGATFAAAARLPHTVGVLTDLDGAASDRALTALRSELRRREALVTAAGVRGVGELPDPPARLVVVVDELRALVEDSPDRLDDLVRIATQGRSLGVHLVLATQRPSGVVSAQLRANVNMRLCLRVLDAADSTDVVGTGDAAALPARPGACLLTTGGAPRRLQVAWLPGSQAQDLVAVAAEASARVRRARREDLLRLHRPWLPALPGEADRASLPELLGGGEVERAPALLVDEPERQCRSTWSWTDGVVLVSGEPRAGRSTALRAMAAGASARGVACHVISRSGWAADEEAMDGPGRAGVTVPTDDPRRVRRLLSLLTGGADPGAALVVDDLEQVLDALDAAAGPGSGQELLTALLRSGHVTAVAIGTTAPHRWAGFAQHHLVLRPRDLGAAGMLGVPRSMVRAAAPPGRGVLLGGAAPLEVQVLTGRLRADADAPVGDRSGLVLAPLPRTVALADLPGHEDRASRPVLGIGGDAAAVAAADLVPGRPWLVCGPPASGRSSVLALLAAQQPRGVLLVTPETTAEEVRGRPEPSAETLLLVDDAELLDTAVADTLVELASRCRTVVATSVTATQTVYRGIVAAVAQARTVIALGGALPPHCAHARAAVDPRGGAGRAVLVTPREVVPLQLAR